MKINLGYLDEFLKAPVYVVIHHLVCEHILLSGSGVFERLSPKLGRDHLDNERFNELFCEDKQPIFHHQNYHAQNVFLIRCVHQSLFQQYESDLIRSFFRPENINRDKNRN